MGINTTFIGAIRITPMVEAPLADKINQYLEIRHMRRNVKDLLSLYKSTQERKERSLLPDGDFGEEGAFFLPVLTKDIQPGMEYGAEGLRNQISANTPPKPCQSLYSNLVLAPSPDGTCSYLGWNGAKKTYEVASWIRLLASVLVPLGYHLHGDILADEEHGMDFYRIAVRDDCVFESEFEPIGTYRDEFAQALAVMRNAAKKEGK